MTEVRVIDSENQNPNQLYHAGQTEAAVGMAASPTSLNPSAVFGPPTPCNICPQYGHAIIFSRKCYYEAGCPLPVLIHKMKTGAGKADRSAVICRFDSDKVQNLKEGNRQAQARVGPAPDSQTLSNHNAKETGVRTSHSFPPIEHPHNFSESVVSRLSFAPIRFHRLKRLGKLLLDHTMWSKGFLKVHYGTTWKWVRKGASD